METKINICDTCKKAVKELNCDFCKDDLCNNCVEKPLISIWRRNIGNIIVCRKCYKKMEEYNKSGFGEKTNKKIVELILTEIKKLNFIVNLNE